MSKTKNYILIDTENISDYEFLKSISDKGDNYTMVFFKSKNSKPIKPEFWEEIFNSGMNLQSVKICEKHKKGSENMDIQMAGFIGQLMCSVSEKKKIYIVSDDNHFNNLANFFCQLDNKCILRYVKDGKVSIPKL